MADLSEVLWVWGAVTFMAYLATTSDAMCQIVRHATATEMLTEGFFSLNSGQAFGLAACAASGVVLTLGCCGGGDES